MLRDYADRVLDINGMFHRLSRRFRLDAFYPILSLHNPGASLLFIAQDV